MVVVKDTKSSEDRKHVCSFVLISTRRLLQRDYDTTIDINSKTTNSYPRKESKAEVKTKLRWKDTVQQQQGQSRH